MKECLSKIYKVGAYYRLSEEDAGVSSHGKDESGSIANQKILIKDFLKGKTDLILCGEYTDDGVSGSSFQRPGFNRLMEDIEAGLIDCVVVKDLSRFGREYIDAGNLLERVFPSLGVRFISINDNVDTIHGMDTLTVAFKNIINDAYCRDISIKTRTNLAVKRKHGQFIGPQTIYGYEKDPQNHNRLIVDEYAGRVVQNIFLWRIQGMSCYGIARKLSEMGVMAPYAYKMHRGIRFYTPFKSTENEDWSQITVRRILEDENYTGTLVQGRYTTPNHKVKTRIVHGDDKVTKVENSHEALVSKRDFALVKKLMTLDVRTAPGEETCYPLSGILTCADCGANLLRRPRTVDGRQYVYYDCQEYSSSHRKRCSSHLVRENKVEDLVLKTIQNQIELLLNMEECMKQLDLTMLMEVDRNRLEKEVAMQSAEVEKFHEMVKGLYEDLYAGVITKEEYISFKEEFELKAKAAEKALADAKVELSNVANGSSRHYKWVEHFLKYQNVTELTREMVVELVDAILVYDKNHIEIVLAFQDEYQMALETLQAMVEKAEKEKTEKEKAKKRKGGAGRGKKKQKRNAVPCK